MSKTGSFRVKFLKSMCLIKVKPNVNEINTKNQFIPFLLSIFFSVLLVCQLLFRLQK